MPFGDIADLVKEVDLYLKEIFVAEGKKINTRSQDPWLNNVLHMFDLYLWVLCY